MVFFLFFRVYLPFHLDLGMSEIVYVTILSFPSESCSRHIVKGRKDSKVTAVIGAARLKVMYTSGGTTAALDFGSSPQIIIPYLIVKYETVIAW